MKEREFQWVQQYKAAAVALEEQHALELQSLTEKQALEISERLLSAPLSWRANPDWSGLVEQQAVLHKLRE